MTSVPATLSVLLPLPLADAYDYLLLPDLDLPPGTAVDVPFGAKVLTGFVWGPGGGRVPAAKLKSIIGPAPLPPLPAVTRQFIDRMADYTVTPPGAVLKMVFGSLKLVAPKKKDIISSPVFDPGAYQPELTADQRAAAVVLIEQVRRAAYACTLLDGVTGSGKTEVFAEAIAECLRQDKQALLLLPEIAMTAALVDRLARRFGARPVEWHSGLSARDRRLHWHAIAGGQAQFILGARSALFLPYPRLGLIVVDEEHEAAYKQEEGVIYQGRDMAVLRAHAGDIPIVLASATPSLETLYNVQQGRYGHVKLPRRFGAAVLPDIALVDLRREKLSAREFIAPALIAGVEQAVKEGQQAMLFLNRRGYAPLTLCRACGNRINCPNCTSWLTMHQQSGKLRCHHCDYHTRIPLACPVCTVEGKLAPCGPGVERVAEEIKTKLPTLRFAVMASDTLDGPQAAQALVGQMDRRELDLLIGTQIMAKGYHFPHLTFAGVVDADLGLGGGDPRAAERVFQLLQQMSGRAGRGDRPGRVLLQTTAPDQPVMQAIVRGDRDGFMAAELREREAYRLPPLWRLASVTVSGENAQQVIALANELAMKAPQTDAIRILGPAPAPFAMLRGKYRHRLLAQAPRGVNLSQVVRQWIAGVKTPRNLRILVDIDPYSFL